MRKFLLGIVCGVCLFLLAGYLFLISGGVPVATKGPSLPLESLIARTAIHVAMKDEKSLPSPFFSDEAGLLSGAKIYMNHCAVCHGFIAGQPSFIAKGLFPKPPQLLEQDHSVIDDPIGEIYWKVKNGLRQTGMPGFVDNLSDTELWQVSQVLINADKLPVSVQQVLQSKTP